jgi:hypothetical protein
MSTATQTVDTRDLERRVKDMYREVAEEPLKEFHFETGRPLAERLGYPSVELDAIPAEAIDSLATTSSSPASNGARSSSTWAAAPGWTASSPRGRSATADV